MLILKYPHQCQCYLTCIFTLYVQLPILFSELFFSKNFFYIEHVLIFFKFKFFFFLQMMKIFYIILLTLSQTYIIVLFHRISFHEILTALHSNHVKLCWRKFVVYHMIIFCRKHALDLYSYFIFMSQWLYILNYTSHVSLTFSV